MKIKHTVVLAIVGVASLQMVHAAKTGPCTPPSGAIDIVPDQKCSGKQTVAIGKELTLKAINLKDKDCYCGKGVQDEIDSSTGVQWSISMGTFTGGDKGTPKTWKATTDTHTDVAVRLKLDDKATAANTTDDGGFTEVASLNLDIVIPNHVATTTSSTACTAAYGGTFGKRIVLSDTVSRSGCTVDFSGLEIRERACGAWKSNGCGFGVGITGTPWNTLGASNDATNNDNHALCCTTDGGLTASCSSDRDCYWEIRASGGSPIQIFTRNYVFSAAADGKCSTIGLTRSIASYP